MKKYTLRWFLKLKKGYVNPVGNMLREYNAENISMSRCIEVIEEYNKAKAEKLEKVIEEISNLITGDFLTDKAFKEYIKELLSKLDKEV